jgi:hypothetical protein
MNYESWLSQYLMLVNKLVSIKQQFTSDDIRLYTTANGLDMPLHPNWWGIAARTAKEMGIATHTGIYTKSRLGTRKGSAVAHWRAV